MTDVLIRDCRVRVVRRSGWSWGPDPRSLADGFMRALPGLLATQLEKLGLSETGDVEISVPVVARVPLSTEELRELTGRVGETVGPCASLLNARLEQALAGALATHLARPAETPSPDQVAEVGHVAMRPLEVKAPAAVLRALLNWQRRGTLTSVLRGFSDEALRSWHDTLRQSSDGPAGRSNSTEVDLDTSRRLVDHLGVPGTSLHARLTLRLLVAVSLLGSGTIGPDSPSLWGALDRLVPLTEAGSASQDPTDRGPETAPDRTLESSPRAPLAGPNDRSADVSVAAGQARTGPPSRRDGAGRSSGLSIGVGPVRRGSRGEVHIPSALPFLMLGPLARTSYLETAQAGFLAAGRVDLLPAFATALAYKALPEPDLGWMRTSNDRAAAAAFAGLDGPLPDPDLDALAPYHAELASPLDASAAQAVLEGRLAGEPLLISRAEGGGWLAIDVPGTFLIAWSETIEDLCRRLASAVGAHCLITSDAATPDVLRAVRDHGLRFLTDAPPARGETWRRVRQGAASWWTNDGGQPEGSLIHLASQLGPSHELATESWHALAIGRRALPRAERPSWDRSLAIAAGLALAQIGWTLWHADEPTNSELVARRFGSLDAVVRAGDDSVRVVLPLGRRSLDLAAAGLLDDVHDVPWLDGRTVSFGKG